MSEFRLRWVAVAGPTASEKTRVAIDLAERFGGEIVNADSRQIYRFMDVGTAKPTAEERARVPHHLFDLVDPSEGFDARRYSDLARAAIREIAARGRVPIIAGGTGLYLRALRGGLAVATAARPELRARLAAIEGREAGALARWLRRLDPETAARLHPKDHVRSIRALEVALATGEPLSRRQSQHRFQDRFGESLLVVLDPGRAALRERIERRSRAMFAGGLVEEVRGLARLGFGPDLRVLQSIGYREAWRVVRGEWNEAEAERELVRSTARLAKRQLTWFRAEKDALWFDPADRPSIEGAVARFLREPSLPSGREPR